MDVSFPYVKVPKAALRVVGPPDPGTRLYRREGTANQVEQWFRVVTVLARDGLVSPGGVSMFAPVSRSGVHKRIREGRLTAFAFHVTETKRGLFGGYKTKREIPYVYIPASECRAWAAEVKERMIRLGRATEEEMGDPLEGATEFWEWDAKWRSKPKEDDE